MFEKLCQNIPTKFNKYVTYNIYVYTYILSIYKHLKMDKTSCSYSTLPLPSVHNIYVGALVNFNIKPL